MPAGRPRDAFIKLLAIGVALIGLGSMVSALTPDLADRTQLLAGVVPVQATRTGTSSSSSSASC